MHGELYNYFVDDHRRLESLLNQAVSNSAEIDLNVYEKFRSGILKHIGMEEKILLPAIQKANGDKPIPIAEKLRLEHGAIAALLVPPPNKMIVSTVKAILANHNLLEEGTNGMYENCEKAVGDSMFKLLEKVRAYPDVPTMPFNTDPKVFEVTRRAVARAGYNFDDHAG